MGTVSTVNQVDKNRALEILTAQEGEEEDEE